MSVTMSAHVSWLLDAAVSRKEEQTSVQVGWNHFLQRSGDAFLRRLWWGLQIEASLLVRHPWFAGKRFNPTLLARHGEDHDSQCHCISAQGVVSCESWLEHMNKPSKLNVKDDRSIMVHHSGFGGCLILGVLSLFPHKNHKTCFWSGPCKANLLGKKLLLINFPSLGGEQACPWMMWMAGLQYGWPLVASIASTMRTYSCLPSDITNHWTLIYFHKDTSMIFYVYYCTFVISWT